MADSGISHGGGFGKLTARVPVSFRGVKLKFLRKDVDEFKQKYDNVTIKKYPEDGPMEGYEIHGFTRDVTRAEKRVKESVEHMGELEVIEVPFADGVKDSDLENLESYFNSKEKSKKSTDWCYSLAKSEKKIFLIGDVGDIVNELESRFANNLELPMGLNQDVPVGLKSDEDHFSDQHANKKRGTRTLDESGHYATVSDYTPSVPDATYRLDLWNFMKKQNPDFLRRIEVQFEVKIADHQKGDCVEIAISGTDKEAATGRLQTDIANFSKRYERGRSSEPEPKTTGAAPPLPARGLKPSKCGLPVLSFRSKATGAHVHVFVYDITKLKVDVIVNAANESLMHGAGVAYAIQKAAGSQLELESKAYVQKRGRLRVTDVAETRAGNLLCKSVFHAVGPMMADYRGDKQACFQDLAHTITNCLEKTERKGHRSVAIPAISSGIFGVDPRDVARIMASVIAAHVEQSGEIQHILLTDIIPETVKLMQEAVRSQGDLEQLDNFQALNMCQADPSFYEPPSRGGFGQGGRGYAQGAGGGRGGGYGGEGERYTQGGGGSYGNVGGSGSGYKYGAGRGGGGDCSGPYGGGGGYHGGQAGGGHGGSSAWDKGPPGGPSSNSDRKGKQPKNGKMAVYRNIASLPGHGGSGRIEITYDFPAGCQEADGPSPNKFYARDTRTAYLPDNTQGRHILKLLEKAFKARQTFAVGINKDTGREGIIWNGIEHKTSPSPGGQWGYPDPGYLDRVEKQLKDKGIEG